VQTDTAAEEKELKVVSKYIINVCCKCEHGCHYHHHTLMEQELLIHTTATQLSCHTLGCTGIDSSRMESNMHNHRKPKRIHSINTAWVSTIH